MRTDEELVIAYRGGEESAFAELVQRHLKSVYGFALRFAHDQNEAEDIAQESFLKAWKQLASYAADRGRFKAWLIAIVRNTAIDHARRRNDIAFSKFDTDESRFAETIVDDALLQDEIIARKDDVAALEHALLELPVPYREILLLYNGSDLTFEEVASVLATSVNTIKSRYRRALAALREQLKS